MPQLLDHPEVKIPDSARLKLCQSKNHEKWVNDRGITKLIIEAELNKTKQYFK